MKEFSQKHSEKRDARQAVREARKAANRQVMPDRIAHIHILPNGDELIVHKPIDLPGNTYAF